LFVARIGPVHLVASLYHACDSDGWMVGE